MELLRCHIQFFPAIQLTRDWVMSAAAEGCAAPTERDAHWGPGAGPGAAGLYQGESHWQQGWGQGSRYHQ